MIEEIIFSLVFQKKYHGLLSVEDYLRIKADIFKAGDLLKAQTLSNYGFVITQAQIDLQRKHFLLLLQRGVRFIYPGHELYPVEFQNLAEPPYLISYLGAPIWLTGQGLSVVGSREVQPQSVQWMDEYLSELLDKKSIFLVSGGARGVDQKAHSLCLLKKKPTIVLVPSGLGALYPVILNSWVKPVLEGGGAIMSEYEFLEPMRKHYFHARNRLISALGVCTLIIQAERRSGTLITGRQAVEQGKPVLVLPSHPLDVHFQGGLDLLAEGATMIRDAQDLEVILESEFIRPKNLALF